MASSTVTGLVLVCVMMSMCLKPSALVKNDEHNLSMGERRPNDDILFEKHVSHGLFWFVVQEETVCFPEKKSDEDKYYITALECINKGEEKQYSGTAKLIYGGVGKPNMCVYLEGYRGSRLDFVCKVFGYNIQDSPDESLIRSDDF